MEETVQITPAEQSLTAITMRWITVAPSLTINPNGIFVAANADEKKAISMGSCALQNILLLDAVERVAGVHHGAELRLHVHLQQVHVHR